MHRPLTKFSHKENSQQVKKPINEPCPPKFTHTIFSCPVFHYFFSNLFKPRPFSQYRNITMHFTIYFNTFHHFFAIGLKSTIKIMQFYFTHLSCCRIE